MPQTSVEASRLESANITQTRLPPSAELRGDVMPQFAGRTFPILFAEQVERNPDAIAIVCDSQAMTYAELDARANELARHLRTLDVGRESLVGICIDRSLDMAIAMLGILKAGAAYLPLDPEYPPDRLAFMIGDARPAMVVTKSALNVDLPAEAPKILLDKDSELISKQRSDALDATSSSTDLAYVIYTSGSTGQPKGVMIEHGNLANYLLALNHELRITSRDVYLHTASIAFSSSRRQLLLPLSQGASVLIATSAQRKDPQALFRMIKESGVTIMDAVPSFWRNCTTILENLDADERQSLLNNDLRLMLSASEPLNSDIPRKWMTVFNHPAQHVHMFGQTETAGIVCLFPVPRDFYGERYVPIGNPIANTTIRILDKKQQPCALEEAGELYIEGAGVGRGYLNRPEVTSEKFVVIDGVRLYRTGDWARLRADCRIEFAGRRDQQIKLRGFRVELSEVEAALSQHPGVRECAVVARDDEKSFDKRLLGYYVRRNGAIDANELRQFMNSRLPDYAVPATFVELKALPLTANGKVNRLALPEPEDNRAGLSTTFVAPENDLERSLAAIWREVLRVEPIGRNDNFIELGGHSLLAAQIVARVRNQLKIEAPISLLLEQPTIAKCAKALATCEAKTTNYQIHRFERNGTAPLSFNQQQFWLLDQSSSNRGAYNVRTALRISGVVDVPKLQRSIEMVIARHEVLRTNIVARDGKGLQLISPAIPLTLEFSDLSHLSEREADVAVARSLDEEAAKPFDLGNGPLLRARLLKRAQNDHVLLLTLHHIICDGWSIDLLVRELTANYLALSKAQNSSAPDLPIQYADFALWQRSKDRQDKFERVLEFWKSELADAPSEIELPTDFVRPATLTLSGGRVTTRLSGELPDALRQISRREGATMFMTLLAAFQTLLYRYTGQEDIVIGSPVAGRSMTETENLIGAFVNTLALRGDVSGNPTFRELLNRVQEKSLAAFAHQDLPFEQLVEALKPERKANQTPLFQVMFTYERAEKTEIAIGDTKFAPMRIPNDAAKFDLTLEVLDERDEMVISFEFAKDLFASETIERLSGHFENLLKSIAAVPDERIGSLSMLSAQDRDLLLNKWNSDTLEVPSNACAHQLFEDRAAANPNAIAAEFNGARLTYGELNARANQLANYLRFRGVGPESLVGISIERSLEMLVALFGVMKAGAGYVPLDPNYPQDRLAFMIADANLALVVTTESLARSLPSAAQPLFIDTEWPIIAKGSAENLTTSVNSNNVAYVIYTSGSTGNPKGVAVEHRSLTNFIFTAASAYEITEGDRMLQFASLSFDLSVEEIFVTLTQGATLVLRTEDMISSARDFLTRCGEWKVSILDLPTAYWHEVTGALNAIDLEIPSSVRLVIIGGEKAAPDRVATWLQHVREQVRLINSYGPTETTVAVTFSKLKRENMFPTGSISIGRPFANTRTYVLDANRGPVPIGVAGELYIGGPGVARGYLNRPDLTADKFIRDPFSANPGDRLYRTGDRVRYLADGQIEFLGRIDNQIKLRGFRVELEEIEEALRTQTEIRDCIVVYDEDQQRLVAYLVPNQSISIADVRNSLKTKLPPYMIPAAFEVIDALPTTANGKIDRRALPEPNSCAEIADDFVPPETPIEELLAAAWREALQVARVGRFDNFFDLGGHSLLAAKAVSLTRQELNIEFTIVDLFRAPTIASLSELLNPRITERTARAEFDRLMKEIAAMTEEEAQDLFDAEFKRNEGIA